MKCLIPCLCDEDALLEQPRVIRSRSFYKELLNVEPHYGVSLADDYWPIATKVFIIENGDLTLPFLPEEGGRAITAMKTSSLPGPDCLPVAFLHRFWPLLHLVIMPIFHDNSVLRLLTWHFSALVSLP